MKKRMIKHHPHKGHSQIQTFWPPLTCCVRAARIILFLLLPERCPPRNEGSESRGGSQRNGGTGKESRAFVQQVSFDPPQTQAEGVVRSERNELAAFQGRYKVGRGNFNKGPSGTGPNTLL